MITKRQMVELIQNRLAGGDVTEDIKGKYPYQVIAYLIGLVYTDVVYSNPQAKKDASVPYDLERQGAAPRFYVELPATPLMGSESLTYVSGSDGCWYPSRMGSIENHIMNILKPQTNLVTNYLQGRKLYFNGTPTETITVEMIPNPNSMSDDDYLTAPGKEAAIFQMVVQMIQQAGLKPEEVYNNNVPDSDKPTQPAK